MHHTYIHDKACTVDCRLVVVMSECKMFSLTYSPTEVTQCVATSFVTLLGIISCNALAVLILRRMWE